MSTIGGQVSRALLVDLTVILISTRFWQLSQSPASIRELTITPDADDYIVGIAVPEHSMRRGVDAGSPIGHEDVRPWHLHFAGIKAALRDALGR